MHPSSTRPSQLSSRPLEHTSVGPQGEPPSAPTHARVEPSEGAPASREMTAPSGSSTAPSGRSTAPSGSIKVPSPSAPSSSAPSPSPPSPRAASMPPSRAESIDEPSIALPSAAAPSVAAPSVVPSMEPSDAPSPARTASPAPFAPSNGTRLSPAAHATPRAATIPSSAPRKDIDSCAFSGADAPSNPFHSYTAGPARVEASAGPRAEFSPSDRVCDDLAQPARARRTGSLPIDCGPCV